MKQPEQARVSHEAAAAVLEDVVTKRPDDIHSRARLARAYAGAGRKAEALREADRVVELFPIFKSGGGAGMSMVSATVAYTTAGEHEAALDVLEFLASIPSWVSYGYLRFEPALDPLREYPRFQKLLADKKKQLPPL